MKIKKANLKRLASLSALGAGALGVSAGAAEASGIVYSGVLDEEVGFGHGFGRSASFSGPNGAGAVLLRGKQEGTQGTGWDVALHSKAGAYGTNFKFLAKKGVGTISFETFAQAFPSGQDWSGGAATAARGDAGGKACAAADSVAGAAGVKSVEHGWVAGSILSCFIQGKATLFRGSDAYLLFEFTGGKLPHNLYGWAQLEVTPRHDYGTTEVTLVDWAYDTSGAQIPAGDTGTPEPSTFALTGLAALALGARGLRAWRATRKS